MLTRLGCLLGVLLMMLSFAMLALFVIVPAVSSLNDNSTFTGVMGALLCRDDETYRADAYKRQHYEGTSYSFTAYCDRPNGLTRQVTDKQTIYGIVAFVTPFLLGLALSIAGFAAVSLRAARRVVQNAGTLVVSSGYAPVGAAQEPQHARASNAPTLAERLQQIQNARDQGLISEAEYDRARRKLLDE